MAEVINLGRFGGASLIMPEGEIGLGTNGEAIFALNLEAATLFFQDIAIRKKDVLLNDMGVYALVNVGRNDKAKYQGLSVPKHLLQSRKNCQVWTPKGKQYFIPTEIPTYAVEYDGEQCADSFFDNCMEKVLPAGNLVNDITATSEGQAVFSQMVNNIFTGLGNSFYDLLHYANDDFADQSNTNGWWQLTNSETAAEWADFRDQQTSTALNGFIPQIELQKLETGASNFQVDIPLADVSGDQYIGTDVTELFEDCIRACGSQLKLIVRRRQGNFGAVYLVTPSIYQAYEEYLISNYTTIPLSAQLLMDGAPVPGVLMYKGVPVIAMDEWEMMDNTIGVHSHRIVLTALGNMVIAHNMQGLQGRQYNGLGFVARQRPELSAKGKYEMYTTFRVGAAIADTDFMVNASIVIDRSGNELTYTA